MSWSWEPLTLFLVGLTGIVYARGWRGTRPLKIRVITPLRATSFLTGLLLLLLALISPLDTLGARLFTFHMAQHMILTHVAVPLILLGAPVLPVLRGMGYGIRRATIVPAAHSARVREVFRIATHPLVTLALFVGCIWAWHVPSLYSAAVTNDFAHIAQHGSFIGVRRALLVGHHRSHAPARKDAISGASRRRCSCAVAHIPVGGNANFRLRAVV